MDYSLQLYSVRDFTEKDLADALRRVAELGYKAVEFAGFFGHSAEEVRAMLDEYGLAVSGTHSSLEDLDRDFAGTVRYHHTIGNKNYILPGAPWGTAAELDDTIRKLDEYAPRLAAEGIRLAYHNHDGEYLPNADGQIAHDIMEQRTSVDFEIDTYWAFVAGRDPLAELERLRDRVHVIHLKDGTRQREGRALGEGTAPVAAVRAKAIELGMRIVVESEGLQPDGMAEVGRCIRYLRTLEK